MTQEELQAIRERCGKATPGPWSFDPDDYYQLDNGSEYVISAEMYGNYAGLGYNEWDADFISHSRDDVPHLLDEIERHAKEIERFRGALDHIAWLFETNGDTLTGLEIYIQRHVNQTLKGDE